MSKSKVSSGSPLCGSLVAVLVWLATAPASASVLYGREALPGVNPSLIPTCAVTINGTTNHTGDSVLNGQDPCSNLGNQACTFDPSQTLPQGATGVCIQVAGPMYFNYTWDPGLFYRPNQIVVDATGAAWIALLQNTGARPGEAQVDAAGNPAVPWQQLGSGSVGATGVRRIGGAGSIAQLGELGIDDLLRTKALVELFRDWAEERFPVYMLYPARHLRSAKVLAR